MKLPTFPSPRSRGFSLIELMVSMSVLSILLVLIFQMLGSMQTTWKRTRQQVSEFKDARLAFDEMSRRISQATLNAYWSYDYTSKSYPLVGKIRYGRENIPESDLHFVCGPSEELFRAAKGSEGVGTRPTHGIFFQAPFGFAIQKARRNKDQLEYEQLNSLLNAWGYYIEFNSDQLDRPRFLNDLNNAPEPRLRYRLMEFRQPTEYLQVYKQQLRILSGKQPQFYRWFSEGLFGVNSEWNTALQPAEDENFFRTTRPLAENIVAMVLLPRTADTEKTGGRRDDLTDDYIYDSRRFQWGSSTQPSVLATRHQLPPIIDISFVAVSESSFGSYISRKNIQDATADPELVSKELFKKTEDFSKDLKSLTQKLTAEKLDYRVFNSSVRIRESKWLISN